jgi:transposase
MIVPPSKSEVGPKLLRGRRRWKTERTIGWLHNFRRQVVRYGHDSSLNYGFLQLARGDGDHRA